MVRSVASIWALEHAVRFSTLAPVVTAGMQAVMGILVQHCNVHPANLGIKMHQDEEAMAPLCKEMHTGRRHGCTSFASEENGLVE